MDYHRSLGEMKPQAEFGTKFAQTVEPYVELFQKAGVDPWTGVGNALAFARSMEQGTMLERQALVRNLAQAYGVQLGPTEQGKPGEVQQPAFDPREVERIVEQRLQRERQAAEQQAQQASFQQKQQQVSAFAADPANKYFPHVREMMGKLLDGGFETTLEGAYKRACMWDENVAALIQSEQARAAANKAPIQPVGVRRRPAPAGTGTGHLSLDEELGAVFDRLQG